MIELINDVVDQNVLRRTADRFGERGIVLPTFAQMKDPSRIPEPIKAKLGDLSGAVSALERVVELAPADHAGYETLARLLIKHRLDFPRALLLADKAVSLRGIAADHELLAQAFAVNQEFERAHQSLSRAIELDPDNQAYLQAMRQLEQFRSARQQ